jgi:tRNA dimethylallyltransferase
MDTLHFSQIDRFLADAKRPLIVILGPTASGKTAFSIALAKNRGDVEIINADSRQIYRCLDIGTAKITQRHMQGVPHHLLSVLDPKQELTAAWYQKQACELIDSVHRRGRVPMLVGGSMLYISGVIDGLDFSGPGDPRKSKNSIPYDLFIIGIDRPRDELMKRINERTAELFAKGWMEEVRGLLKKGYTAKDPAMKSHGYREIMEQLGMENGKWKIDDAKELISLISRKTRQYAKRQMTWWRPDTRIVWIAPSGEVGLGGE